MKVYVEPDVCGLVKPAVKEDASLGHEILADEIVLMGYGFLNPQGADPTMDCFTQEQFGLARDVIQYTLTVDNNLGITVTDDESNQTVPRHVLLTYKMLMYNTVCEANRAKQRATFYAGLTAVLTVGIVVLGVAANTANFLEALQAFVDVLKR